MIRPPPFTLAAASSALVSAILISSARPESLEDAWYTALAQNQRLAAARMEQRAAAEGVNAAAAERLPNLSVRSGYTLRSAEPSFVIRDPLPGLGTFEFPYAQDNSANAGADVRFPIYTSGRIASAIDSASAQKSAADDTTEQARLDLFLAVGEAYLEVQRLESDVDATQREWESLQAHAKVVASQRSTDRAAESDLLAAQVAATAAWQRRLQQGHALEVARGQYNRLLGRPIATRVELSEVHLPPLTLSFEQLLETAYERRPDIRRLVAMSSSHEFESARLKGTARPQVSGSVGTLYDENRYANPQTLATAGVVVEWQLYNGGRLNAQAEAETARAAGLRCLAEDQKAQVALDLLEAWNQQQESQEQREVASQLLTYTSENMRVTQLRFEQGVALSAAVLQAEAQLAQARRDLQRATYQAARAQLRIRYLAGLL